MSLASATAEDAALTGIVGASGLNGGYLSAHTATTGTSGASEVTYQSGARGAITWASASAGSVATSNSQTLQIPASTTITYCGTWTASTSGTFYIGAALTTSQTFSSTGALVFAIGAVTFSAS
jgi:hypothetical protein